MVIELVVKVDQIRPRNDLNWFIEYLENVSSLKRKSKIIIHCEGINSRLLKFYPSLPNGILWQSKNAAPGGDDTLNNIDVIK